MVINRTNVVMAVLQQLCEISEILQRLYIKSWEVNKYILNLKLSWNHMKGQTDCDNGDEVDGADSESDNSYKKMKNKNV